MKKAHKLISAVLVSTMVLSMTACGSGEKTYKVGILQQLEHPALDQATQGFQDALTKLMGDSRRLMSGSMKYSMPLAVNSMTSIPSSQITKRVSFG